jgi:sodium/potassium/calcium exchanger 4
LQRYAVGSNVFDIWLGLGLPWLCYLSWQTPDYILVNTTEVGLCTLNQVDP